MTKTIDSLISDMYDVIEGKGGWDATITEFLSEGIAGLAAERFKGKQEVRDRISPSNLGTKCDVKLWRIVNTPDEAEPLDAQALGTFFYGDILEILCLALAKAAGHKVEGLQEKLKIGSMEGSGDCIIDGMVVDVKSASSFGFKKFEDNNLKEDDPFGYISQISSYLYGYRKDPRVTYKDRAAFLVVKKDRFKLCLDEYDLADEVAFKLAELTRAKEVVQKTKAPENKQPAVPDGKSGNYKLGTMCSYCQFKKSCWPNMRTFIYSTGPRYLTAVKRVPNVPEAYD
jgi:hypothetical protein